MKVNLGCGDFPLDDWLNVDSHSPSANLRADFRTLDLSGVEEVLMEHALEHVPWADVPPLLTRIRSWMVSGGRIKIEVPDMAEIMRRADEDQFWVPYIYGSQAHEGEYHRSGFTERTLTAELAQAGFQDVQTRTFPSEHVWRTNMPCLEAIARA